MKNKIVWGVALLTVIPWWILSGAGWLGDKWLDVMDRLWRWAR